MLLVALTGGIGSGKSTVAALLAEHGAVIVDSDQIVRDLQAPGTPLLAAMAARFGPGIIRPDGSLDRAAVAATVFADTPEARAALADLNALVHPAVWAEQERRIAAEAGTDRVVVLDIPLLVENPRDDLAAVVVVDLPVAEQVRRLVGMRAMPQAAAEARIARQSTREQRLAIATHVVDNSGSLDDLRAEVETLWADLRALAAAGSVG